MREQLPGEEGTHTALGWTKIIILFSKNFWSEHIFHQPTNSFSNFIAHDLYN